MNKKASPAIVVNKIIVHPMTDRCSSFVQALCKYIYIILWWQGEIHITFLQLVILALKLWPLHQKILKKRPRPVLLVTHLSLKSTSPILQTSIGLFDMCIRLRWTQNLFWGSYEISSLNYGKCEDSERESFFYDYLSRILTFNNREHFNDPLLLVWRTKLNKWKLHKFELKCGLKWWHF